MREIMDEAVRRQDEARERVAAEKAAGEVKAPERVRVSTPGGTEARAAKLAEGLTPGLCPGCGVNRTVGDALCGACEIRKREDPTVVLAKLERLGINVPARGLYGLKEVLAKMAVPVRDEVLAFVKDLREAGPYDQVQGLILEGPTGVGKSWIMAAIIREVLEVNVLSVSQIVYDESRIIWGLIKERYGTGGANAELKKRMRCRLWALDDFGTEVPTEDTGNNLVEILTARELRPTMMTANIPRDDHGDRYDPEVWDRIKSRLGARNFRVVQVVGKDHRELPLDDARRE